MAGKIGKSIIVFVTEGTVAGTGRVSGTVAGTCRKSIFVWESLIGEWNLNPRIPLFCIAVHV